jgi:hypothetical protein
MQKPFKKCVFPVRVSRFLHIRKKLIRRFQKKTAIIAENLQKFGKIAKWK